MHPLMAGYAAGCILLLYAVAREKKAERWTLVCVSCSLALVFASCLFISGSSTGSDYLQAARSRTYRFLVNRYWYEIAGLILNWLPPRDSNPDMLIQSQLSCR